MKGYAILTAGAELDVKTQDYIDNSDPGFFQRNRSMILLVWKFDTDNEGQMFDLMNSFKNRQLNMVIVKDFCLKIGFDLKAFLAKNRQTALIFNNSESTIDASSFRQE